MPGSMQFLSRLINSLLVKQTEAVVEMTETADTLGSVETKTDTQITKLSEMITKLTSMVEALATSNNYTANLTDVKVNTANQITELQTMVTKLTATVAALGNVETKSDTQITKLTEVVTKLTDTITAVQNNREKVVVNGTTYAEPVQVTESHEVVNPGDTDTLKSFTVLRGGELRLVGEVKGGGTSWSKLQLFKNGVLLGDVISIDYDNGYYYQSFDYAFVAEKGDVFDIKGYNYHSSTNADFYLRNTYSKYDVAASDLTVSSQVIFV